MNDNIIPIFFTIDDEYAQFACTAITSIIENASKEYNYKINIVHRGLSDENILSILVFKEKTYMNNFWSKFV